MAYKHRSILNLYFITFHYVDIHIVSVLKHRIRLWILSDTAKYFFNRREDENSFCQEKIKLK